MEYKPAGTPVVSVIALSSVMPRTQNPIKPSAREPKIKVNDSYVNPSDMRGLQWAWRDKRLVLFLGAGVSIPYGIPSWNNLVLELLFEQAEHTRRLGRMLPHYRRAVAAWMTDYFDYSPLVLARMVERDAKKRSLKKGARATHDGTPIFLEQLRTLLYAEWKSPSTRTTLQAIGDLIEHSRGNIRCVVNFNFDGLLEEELEKRQIQSISIYDGGRQHSDHFRIIHPHGFVPRNGPIVREHVVFTENDYHDLTHKTFHWGLSEIVNELRHSTVLFIGLSMSDPSLRRLLDAAQNSKIPPHWQLQKRHQVRDQEQQAAMADITTRANRWGKILGIPGDKNQSQLAEALNAVLRQADSYDGKVFQSMGVKTIWLNSFDDIPELLDRIRVKPKPRKKVKP
jgi:SIR2-like protein